MASATYQAFNSVHQVLTTGYTAGSGTLTVPDGSAFGTPSAGAPVLVTAFLAADPTVPVVNLQVTGRTGDTLTIAAVTWGADTNLAAGDLVAITPAAELFDDLKAAVNSKSDSGHDHAGTYQPLDGDLTALAALGSTGLVARTAGDTYALRTLAGPAAGITVSNGNGVSGNPTLALAHDLAAVEGIATTGFAERTASDTWTARALVAGDIPDLSATYATAAHAHDAADVGYDDANTGLDATNVQDAIDNLNAIVALGGNANAQGSWLITGGGVAWITGYQYRVSAAQYYILGIAHTSTEQTVTLDAADATYDRFDIIALDDTGTAVKLTGTPAPSPELPDLDPQTQLQVTIIRVDASTTAPPATSTDTIYQENAGAPGEWTGTASAGTITLGSTNNPRSGTKCVEGTSVANGTYFQFAAAAPFNITAKQDLVFYVRSKGSFARQKSIRVQWLNGASAVGNAITLTDGFFGFDSANTAGYQQIVIPIAQFAIAAGTNADRVRFTVSGGGASIGFYFDDARLQSEVAPPPPNTGITQDQADARYAQRAQNLSDLTSASLARTNLGLGAQATKTIGGALAFSFGGSGTPEAGNDKTPWLYVGHATTGVRLTLSCKTAPTGNFQVTVKRSSNSGSTFPDTVASVTVGSGAKLATTTTITNASLAAGDTLRIDIASVNGAADWTARLTTTPA